MVRAALLPPGEFFTGLRKGVKAALPPDLRRFETGHGRGRLTKLHYGHSEFHYEAWHHTGAGRLEVGLHFEGAPELNRQALDFFRPRMVQIKASLPRAELEPWDRGWSRLYETLQAPYLDQLVLHGAVERLAAYIIALQPLVTVFWNEHEA